MVLLIKVVTAVQVWVSAEQWGEAVPSASPTHWGTVTFWTNPKSWRAANWPSNSQFPATHNQTASFLSWHSFKTLVIANLLGGYWLSPVLLEGSRCFASKQNKTKKKLPVNKTLQQKMLPAAVVCLNTKRRTHKAHCGLKPCSARAV